MKTIRNMTIVMGLFLALLALVATGANAQVLSKPSFTGTLTLPVQAQWGPMTLPAGEYTLRYDTPLNGGPHVVTVVGKEDGSPRGMILPRGQGAVSGAKNVLNCVREDNTLFVRALELPAIGESIHFRIPHGVEVRSKLVAKNHSRSGKTRFVQVAIRIEPPPVK